MRLFHSQSEAIGGLIGLVLALAFLWLQPPITAWVRLRRVKRERRATLQRRAAKGLGVNPS